MDDQPGLKGHIHHWYEDRSDGEDVWWSCAGCSESKRTSVSGDDLT